MTAELSQGKRARVDTGFTQEELDAQVKAHRRFKEELNRRLLPLWTARAAELFKCDEAAAAEMAADAVDAFRAKAEQAHWDLGEEEAQYDALCAELRTVEQDDDQRDAFLAQARKRRELAERREAKDAIRAASQLRRGLASPSLVEQSEKKAGGKSFN